MTSSGEGLIILRQCSGMFVVYSHGILDVEKKKSKKKRRKKKSQLNKLICARTKKNKTSFGVCASARHDSERPSLNWTRCLPSGAKHPTSPLDLNRREKKKNNVKKEKKTKNHQSRDQDTTPSTAHCSRAAGQAFLLGALPARSPPVQSVQCSRLIQGKVGAGEGGWGKLNVRAGGIADAWGKSETKVARI